MSQSRIISFSFKAGNDSFWYILDPVHIDYPMHPHFFFVSSSIVHRAIIGEGCTATQTHHSPVSGSLPVARAEDDIDEEAADEDVDVDGDDSKYIISHSIFVTFVV